MKPDPNPIAGIVEVEEAAGHVLRGFVVDLRRAVEHLGVFLSGAAGSSFQGRLERLERDGRETNALREIQQTVEEHGLVEFRAALNLILERMESDWFEIALFGRVSSGKSSLLNHVLGSEVLPVGVTPVTALPTRLLYGAQAELSVEYGDRPQELLPVTRLVDFVSEQGNPGNRRHVSRVDVYLPAPRLRGGICFVDTPGIGSLAGVGTEEALAYLPRCDLGVNLVDAESGDKREVTVDGAALDAYRRRLAGWQTELRAIAGKHGGRYALLRTGVPLRRVLLQDLRRARIVQ